MYNYQIKSLQFPLGKDWEIYYHLYLPLCSRVLPPGDPSFLLVSEFWVQKPARDHDFFIGATILRLRLSLTSFNFTARVVFLFTVHPLCPWGSCVRWTIFINLCLSGFPSCPSDLTTCNNCGHLASVPSRCLSSIVLRFCDNYCYYLTLFCNIVCNVVLSYRGEPHWTFRLCWCLSN